ncbi:lysM and putative peptidoglycan-binding domain-containing protein 1-like [Haemaphysalis longicornis]
MSASGTGANETALLGSFARKQVKYGSTCKYVSRSGKTIKHVVQPNDTLQGIALRYGVTTEELKRANRLWTSDSLFLRPWLAVPVLEAHGGGLGAAPPGGGDGTNGPPREPPLQPDESMTDFLGRIDSSIARSRNQLRLLSSTRFGDCSPPGEDAPAGGVAARDSVPAPVVMTRQVKHSLQRHERDHEEIFQL